MYHFPMPTTEFLIDSDRLEPEALLGQLLSLPKGSLSGVHLSVRQARHLRDAAAASTILSAVVTSGAMSALVAGLMKIFESKTSPGKIVIKSATGASLEVPSNCPVEKLRELAAIVEQMERPRIHLES